MEQIAIREGDPAWERELRRRQSKLRILCEGVIVFTLWLLIEPFLFSLMVSGPSGSMEIPEDISPFIFYLFLAFFFLIFLAFALLRVYVENGRTMAHTEQGTYALKGPLYEWEQRLDPRAFVRVSQSEIIHLKKVKAFDLNLAGTVLVRLTDGTVTYASRRYVAKIKTLLGL